jgi:RNA polymerase sigma factor (sigma-70 family)
MSSEQRLIDELLVLRCQEGDSAAFEELVGRWQERLWRHAWRLTEDDDAAWDVLQEAWIGISRGIRGLADPAAFPGWAYRIVSHKCRDWLRRRRRRRRLEELYGTEAETLHDRRREEREYATLHEALEQISRPDRAILSLRYEDEFDTAEIAAILEIPEGTVKSRLFYARKRLKKFLEECHE